MKKRNGGTASERGCAPDKRPPLLLLGFDPQFYRIAVIAFNNQFRFFHNPKELEAYPRMRRSRV
jgi:hypothetical protein